MRKLKEIFRRTYIYICGRAVIKSDIPIDKKQKAFIVSTINEIMNVGDYEPCYKISRKIFYELGYPLYRVETKCIFRMFFLILKK